MIEGNSNAEWIIPKGFGDSIFSHTEFIIDTTKFDAEIVNIL